MAAQISRGARPGFGGLSCQVVFEPLAEGCYQVVVPAIPEICTYGHTLDEAREMARDAIRCVLESAMKLGEEIPEDVGDPVMTERAAVTLPH